MKKYILILIILSTISIFSQFEIIAEGQLNNENKSELSYFPIVLSDNSLLLTFKGFHPV